MIDAAQEELHPDLVPFRTSGPGGVDMIHHPLVVSIMHADAMNSYVNKAYEMKRHRMNEALQSKDWGSYVFWYERPYRFSGFAEVADAMSDEEYWELLASVWTDSENIWQTGAPEFMRSNRPHRHRLMSEVERVFLQYLPDKLTVYRGHQFHNECGLSWTLSPSIAEWFARRLSMGDDYGLIQAEVNKSEVIAVFLERGEVEVVVEPDTWVEFEPSVPGEFAELIPVDFEEHIRRKSLHGVDHWARVERNAIELAQSTPNVDLLVVRMFAWLHDTQRRTESTDPEHGLRAAKFVRDNSENLKSFGLSDTGIDLLATACKDHENGFVSNDPTIGVCWDADRLDLMRVGVMPVKALLSTAAAKAIPWTI